MRKLAQQPPLFWCDAALKTGLICLLLVGAFSGLQQFEGKAFLWRLITYPVAAFAVPVIWGLRGRNERYPYAADILFTLPLIIDAAGNALDLYDTIWWWDDAKHLVNWAILSGAVGALAWRCRTRTRETVALVVGFGAVTAILWEFSEYVAFIRNSPELATAYTDTLGDLGLGLTGSVIAALLTIQAQRLWRPHGP